MYAVAGHDHWLTYWGQDKMAAISLMTFSNVFPWMKTFEFKQNDTEICSLGSNSRYDSTGSDKGLVLNKWQAIIWSNVGMFYWHVYASLGLNVLTWMLVPSLLLKASTKFLWFLYARLKNGTYYAVAMSVCPSVSPSVPVFRTFLQHALRYQFETWYMHSVGGTTCRVWVASQLGHFDLVYSQK